MGISCHAFLYIFAENMKRNNLKRHVMDLSVSCLGLDLNSPIVVGSSSLMASVAKLKKTENSGTGAVVLKSIFESKKYDLG